MLPDIKALGFDVFGTVVDWRTSISREGEAFGRAYWTKLNDLHRMALDQLLNDFGIKGIAEADIDHLNRAWHRLDPWPDAVPGSGFELRTAFVPRPKEHGPGQTKDLTPDGSWDVVARDFEDLTDKLGC